LARGRRRIRPGENDALHDHRRRPFAADDRAHRPEPAADAVGDRDGDEAHVDLVAGTRARVIENAEDHPGLRLAQKYAVRVGGGANNRIGLFDGILIKENHIVAAGGIGPALAAARAQAKPGTTIQIEVETLAQLEEAIAAGGS
jgi:hypothetical protein